FRMPGGPPDDSPDEGEDRLVERLDGREHDLESGCGFPLFSKDKPPPAVRKSARRAARQHICKELLKQRPQRLDQIVATDVGLFHDRTRLRNPGVHATPRDLGNVFRRRAMQLCLPAKVVVNRNEARARTLHERSSGRALEAMLPKRLNCGLEDTLPCRLAANLAGPAIHPVGCASCRTRFRRHGFRLNSVLAALRAQAEFESVDLYIN